MQNQYNSVPLEMRSAAQWVCYRLFKGRKVPINPHNGRFASCNKPETWGTFDQCVAAFEHNKHVIDQSTGEPVVSGIGFVLTADDEFACIDLDLGATPEVADKQNRIYNTYKDVSYCELSPSGGLHVWLKTPKFKVCKSDKIEFYFESRFITVTGNTIDPKIDCLEYEANIDSLITWIRPQHNIECEIIYEDVTDAEFSDDEICNQAYNAANGKKFYDLFYGDWQAYYASQSEADFALINILAFYSKSNAQVKNIFRKSALSSRPKAQRDDYVDGIIRRSRDAGLNAASGVDLVALKDFIEQNSPINNSVGIAPSYNASSASIDDDAFMAYISSLPKDDDGVTQQSVINQKAAYAEAISKEFDNEIYTSNTPAVQAAGDNLEPVCSGDQQVEMSEPINFAAYEGDGNLLNDIAEYVYQSSPRPVKEFGVAAAIAILSGITGRCYNVSGTGLNQYTLMLAPSGVGKEAMASGIDNLINCVADEVPEAEDFVGAGDVASSQALINKMANGSKSFVSIFGEFGLKMKQMSAANAPAHLVGFRAAMLDLYNKSGRTKILRPSIYADDTKNKAPIKSPNFSFLGESTPMRFYEGLTEDMVLEGLLPRFNILEYEGIRVPFNKDHLKNSEVPAKLKERLTSLCRQCVMLNNQDRVADIGYSEDAEAYLDKINEIADDKINSTTDEVERVLWNRVHIKVLKLAALAAVSRDMYFPEIRVCDVEWAYNIILQNTIKIVNRFKKGVQEDATETCFQALNNHLWAEYSTATYVKHADLYEKFKFKAPFRVTENGRTRNLLNQTVIELQEAGILSLVDKTLLRKMGMPHNSKVYQILKHPDKMTSDMMPDVMKEFEYLKKLTKS